MRRLTRLSLCAFSALALAAGACGGDDSGGGNADASANNADAAGGSPDAPINYDARPIPDAAPPIDAIPANLSCLGGSLPTTAPATLTLSGNTQTVSLSGLSPVAGATVTAKQVSDDSTVGTPDTSDNSGAFSISAPTGGVPLDAYLEITHGSYWDTLVYPPVPVSQDFTGVAALLVNDGQVSLIQSLYGVSHDGNGIVGVIVLDCDNNPIQGATVSTNPAGGDVLYNGPDGLPDSNATSTGADGVAQIYSVPTGTVTVNATARGMTLRARDVKTASSQLSSTAIGP